MTRFLPLFTGVLIAPIVALMFVTCGGSESEPTPSPSPTVRTELLTGDIRLDRNDTRGDRPGPCRGSGGYDDIEKGAGVTVRDADGKIVGTTNLGAGRIDGHALYGECSFLFSVSIPVTSDFYTIEVSHRGEISYSVEKLEEAGWSLNLSLGQ